MTPEGEIGNLVSDISLAKIQASIPLLHGTRNYQRIQDIEEHLPEFGALLSDSPAMMVDKLQKAQRNLLRIEAHSLQYLTKGATTAAPAPVLDQGRAQDYFNLARTKIDPSAWAGDPAKAAQDTRKLAREWAQADGWRIP
jgi:hypothetical protein